MLNAKYDFIMMIMQTHTCFKCGNQNVVKGKLGTPTQSVVNVFDGNAIPPIGKLITTVCLNCGFFELYLDKNK